jgi:hypothetical protein
MLRKTLLATVTMAMVGTSTLALAGTASAFPSCLVMNGVLVYSDLQTAIDAASIGDTLTVDGVCYGPFTVTQSISVDGSGINTATLTAEPGASVLTVNDGATFSGSTFTLTGGVGADGGAGVDNVSGGNGGNGGPGQPGGILNEGETDLTDVLVSSNAGGNGGMGGAGDSESGIGGNGGMGGAGGIESSGVLSLDRVTVDSNVGGYAGDGGPGGAGQGEAGVGGTGGVAEYYGDGVGGEGFGPVFPGAFYALRSTISTNTGQPGGSGTVPSQWPADGAGGVTQFGPSSGLQESTISGNSGTDAYSLIEADGGLLNTTIAQNVGVGFHVYSRAEAPFQMRGNLVAENLLPVNTAGVADCQAEISVPEDHNFFGTGCGGMAPDATDLSGNTDTPLDPHIGVLAANGGPTLTHALLTGSPAIDAGGTSCLESGGDQRGMNAPTGSACDMGSFEVQTLPVMRPDAMVALNGATLGNDVYGPNASGQSIVGKIGPHETRVFTFTFQNDGEAADTFRLSGPGSTSLVTATYYSGVEGTTDITDQVVAGTFTTASIAPGDSMTVRLSLQAGSITKRTIQKWQMKARSVTDSTKADAARAVAKLLPRAQAIP